MKKIKIAATLAFIALRLVAIKAQTPEHILKNYELVWSDDFNGKAIDTLKWNYRDTGNKRNVGYVRTDNCFVDGKGHLVIEVMQVDTMYTIGQIGTQNTFMTKYGYFECRAQMNVQPGPHVAFWLQSPTIHEEKDNPQQYGTEIDIFEYHIAEGLNNVYHNLHWNGYKQKHQHAGTKVKVDGINRGFHTFGVEWTKDEYIFYVDGIETWRTQEAVSNIEEYMILSAELTGWGGDYRTADFPDQVLFDYVRVYKPFQNK
ncbi:glycoside hydrolase family 16 protein [Carboxylicivirga sediminis]|uniref:Glycoside hydrolase family 16 protein n=1 Tax=Carboxylicivirga sediminis TaxID=2006564 RepID=A0A941IWP2_9BACT|nr:glycoside hydrolase family 16 protein [Carboxylicivirga sediminis]MBR8534569.1 glycoside hydrolase family 16 protein [Carboxylicivirga sediminis]